MIDPLQTAVPDTNIVVSAFILPHSVPAQALRRLQQQCAILISPEIRAEMDEVIRRPKFDRHVPLEIRLAVFHKFL